MINSNTYHALCRQLLGVLLLSLLCLWEVCAQNTDSLMQKARFFRAEKDLVSSLRCYLQIARINETNKKNEQLASIYYELGEVYEEGNLYEKALEYFQKANSIKPTNNTMMSMAEMSVKLRRYEQALDEYTKLLSYARSTSDQEHTLELSVLRKIVAVNQYLGRYEEALSYNQEILKIYTELGDLEGQVVTLNNIGYAQKHLKNYSKAIQSFQEVFKLERNAIKPLGNKTTTLINLGITHQNNGDYQLAMTNLLEAVAIVEQSNNTAEMAQIYDIISVVYLSQKDYYNAAYYNDLAAKYAKKNNDKATLSKTFYTASLLAQADEKYDKALELFQKHLLLKDSLVIANEIRQQGLLQQQFVVEKAEKEIKLLMVGEEIKDLALKQLKVEAEKKVKELELLQREKELQNAQLSKEEAEKKNALQQLLLAQQKANAINKDKAIAELQRIQALKELEIQKQMAVEQEKQNQIQLLTKNKKLQELELQSQSEILKRQQEQQRNSYWFIALGVFIFLLVLVGLLFSRQKNKQLSEQQYLISEKNAELHIQNEKIAAQRDVAESLNLIIARKNEDITASINYAKRIQQAMLPLNENLIALFGENSFFILNMPRDIVSGDFYWLSQKSEEHNTRVLAVADCTGHGVPGSLMSMVGMNALDMLVNRQGLMEPHQILQALNSEIPRVLNQKETEIRDGMDIVVVTINPHEKKITAAAAMNSFCVAYTDENRQPVFKEFKGDNLSIGGSRSTGKASYQQHEIEAHKATIYLYSDGYQDQFGGSQKRKFMSRKFKQLLEQIASESMSEQKSILSSTIENWMQEGNEQQIDDILVLGIKIELNS
ncbi:MAG: hypothetical protein EAZ57_11440 [Cytophagales bacterium]|nr:MAG: hypothetical protein EAZ67_12375 [Cytophagales bacterium]TAF59374.1 MAG: hypothetical protein EAZ57_11440 [Cytophagales bacterium]